jgi:hypothetical protein
MLFVLGTVELGWCARWSLCGVCVCVYVRVCHKDRICISHVGVCVCVCGYAEGESVRQRERETERERERPSAYMGVLGR